MTANRLLSVNNYYYRRGGAETLFLDHNRLFTKCGWDVRPFAMRHPLNDPSPWQEAFVEEIEYGKNYGMARKIISGAKAVYSFEARQKILQTLDQFKPDICHAHNIYHHLSTSILHALKKRGVPTVLTLHDFKLACPAYTMLNNGKICERCRGGVHNVITHRCIKGSFTLSSVVFVEALLTRFLKAYEHCVDRFVSPSRFLIDKFSDWGIDTRRFVHIPNFVEVDKIGVDYKRRDMYVFIGRLAPEKGVLGLADVFIENGRNLVIAGDGPLRDELASKVSGFSNIQLRGRLSAGDVGELLGSCKAIMVPSENFENCPMSILEAFAHSVPVIATAHGGLAEMVADGDNGMLFAPDSSAALTAAVDRFESTTPAERKNMMNAARTTAVEKYSPQQYRESVCSLYAELL